MSDSGAVTERIDRLLEEVRNYLRRGMHKKVQKELASTLSLLPFLHNAEHRHLVGQAEQIADTIDGSLAIMAQNTNDRKPLPMGDDHG